MAAPPATRRAETSFTGLGKRNTSFSATTKSILEWSGFTARTDGGGAVSGLYWPASSTRRRVCVQAILVAIQVVLAILVMLGILLQSPKATGLGGVIGGGCPRPGRDRRHGDRHRRDRTVPDRSARRCGAAGLPGGDPHRPSSPAPQPARRRGGPRGLRPLAAALPAAPLARRQRPS